MNDLAVYFPVHFYRENSPFGRGLILELVFMPKDELVRANHSHHRMEKNKGRPISGRLKGDVPRKRSEPAVPSVEVSVNKCSQSGERGRGQGYTEGKSAAWALVEGGRYVP